MLLWLSLLTVSVSWALEEVPHASGIKTIKPKIQTPVATPAIRRAPVVPAEGLSLVPHARRMSTGVRRAPDGVQLLNPKPIARPAPKVVRPPAVPAIPLLPLIPLPLIPLPQPGKPGALPTLHPLSLPALPTLPTVQQIPLHLPPAPGGPITLAPMPTMPGLTMPPSFQRLLGMTTPTPQRREERREYPREEKVYDDERVIKNKKKGLSSVSSRLPKFVDNEDDVVSPEKNADWIVPF